MQDSNTKTITIRQAEPTDGGKMQHLAEQSPPLDINSKYCYLLMSTHFSQTCTVAVAGEELVGFQTGYFKPQEPGVLFIWQIAVGSAGRGQGLAKRMVRDLLSRFPRGRVSFLEQTVTKSNEASRALFTSVARELGAPIEETLLFGPDHFGAHDHEPEYLLRIGPIQQNAPHEQENKFQGVL